MPTPADFAAMLCNDKQLRGVVDAFRMLHEHERTTNDAVASARLWKAVGDAVHALTDKETMLLHSLRHTLARYWFVLLRICFVFVQLNE